MNIHVRLTCRKFTLPADPFYEIHIQVDHHNSSHSITLYHAFITRYHAFSHFNPILSRVFTLLFQAIFIDFYSKKLI